MANACLLLIDKEMTNVETEIIYLEIEMDTYHFISRALFD